MTILIIVIAIISCNEYGGNTDERNKYEKNQRYITKYNPKNISEDFDTLNREIEEIKKRDLQRKESIIKDFAERFSFYLNGAYEKCRKFQPPYRNISKNSYQKVLTKYVQNQIGLLINKVKGSLDIIKSETKLVAIFINNLNMGLAKIYFQDISYKTYQICTNRIVNRITEKIVEETFDDK